MLNQLGGNRQDFDVMQDFMGVSSVDKVVEELQRLGDTTLGPNKCYSDSVFLFNKTFVKSRFICVITSHSISFFNNKKSRLIKMFFLKALKSISISSDNFTLMVMHFDKQPDLLVESYRRLDLISYLNEMVS